MRTTLTALGVSVGVSAIVAFGLIVGGWWQATNAAIRLDDADLLVFQRHAAADLFSMLNEQETRAALREIPEVQDADGVLWFVLPVDEQPFCVVLGARYDELTSRRNYLVRGRNPAARNEVALGKVAAHILRRDVGSEIHIRGAAYRVVGVFDRGVVFLDGAVAMTLEELQELSGRVGQVTAFQVRLRPGATPAAVAERIEREQPGLVAISDASEYSKVDQGLEMAHGLVWAISIVATLIGGIVVANTMWMSVLERTRDIGVLRAIGWSRRRIVGGIVLEATGVGIIACAVGSLAGAGLAESATWLPTAGRFIQPGYTARPFLLALTVAVVLSVIGALMPAWRAARVSPAEALRYE